MSKKQFSAVSNQRRAALGGVGRRMAVAVTAWTVVALSALFALVVAPTASSAVVAENIQANIRLQGSVEEAAPGEGIDTQDELRYRITIANQGPDDIPAGSLVVVASVTKADGSVATIEVSRFNGPLGRASNGSCGVGRQETLTCTNRQDIDSGRDISLVFGNRHPTAEAGPLTFSITVAAAPDTFTDTTPGNNGFSGPSYTFAEQPITTTTTTIATTTTTMMADTTTTVDPNEPTTTVDPNEPTTTVDPNETTTTTLETTTTILETTTTVAPTTTLAPTTATTVAPPTTVEVTTSIAAMADDEAALPGQESSSSVLGATGETEDPTTGGEALALGPTAQDSGGTPWLLLGGIFAILLLIGGVGLALYAHYNRPPPLVDIRQYQ